MILDRESQFVVELTKELNSVLRIEMRLLMVFYIITSEQTKDKLLY